MRFAWISLLVLVAAAPVACYGPNIKNGGLMCGDGFTCPEGYACDKVDNHCWTPDSGPVCTYPHVQPIACDNPAAGGSGTCSPACQTGCACGRCTIIGGNAVCETSIVGTKMGGEACDPTKDDCAPGYGCRPEPCGTNLGRCWKFCTDDADCAGSGCSGVYGSARVCDPLVTTCDPVKQTGCPDPALTCYPASNFTSCACPGKQPTNYTCSQPADCVPGSGCLNMPNGTPKGTFCFPVCDTRRNSTTSPGNPDCPADGGVESCTLAFVNPWGYCHQ